VCCSRASSGRASRRCCGARRGVRPPRSAPASAQRCSGTFSGTRTGKRTRCGWQPWCCAISFLTHPCQTRARLHHNGPWICCAVLAGKNMRVSPAWQPGTQHLLCAQVRFRLTPQLIHQTFAEKPAVRRAYTANVPHNMDEKAFWTKYLRLQLKEQARGRDPDCHLCPMAVALCVLVRG